MLKLPAISVSAILDLHAFPGSLPMLWYVLIHISLPSEFGL